ncbi:MAG TPA: c-type cytochrome domain-containing protein, partial [Planctomycetaceae bacterium]|nr:c-type cytochrome domain-containing protein [Planctomycetaceae bacterium]
MRNLCFVLFVALGVFPFRLDAQEPPDSVHFEKHVRPVLVEQCFDCHSDGSVESNLRLDSLAGMLK